MAKAIIFTGGGGPDTLPEELFEDGDYLVAADSGYDCAKALGRTVHYVLGDFDSTEFRDEALLLNHTVYSSEKDYSDTYLAIEKGLSEVDGGYVLIGGGGYRLDHLMETYALFSQFGPPLQWFTKYESNILVQDYRRLEGLQPGSLLSMYPATLDGRAIVSAKELQWPLHEMALSFSSFSLSNVCIKNYLEVVVQGDPIFVSFPVAPNLAKVLR